MLHIDNISCLYHSLDVVDINPWTTDTYTKNEHKFW